MVYLVAPDPNSFISGGNIFNQQILDGFASLNIQHERIVFEDCFEYCTHPKDTLIFDSIYFDDLTIEFVKGIRAKKCFLIHLLPSMLGDDIVLSKEKPLLHCFDTILANSQYTCDYLMEKMGGFKSIVIVQPFIKLFVSDQNNSSKKRIIHVANWSPSKQIDLLLSEMAIQSLPQNLIIYFYGDSQRDQHYFNSCKEILDSNPKLSKHVMIMGSINHDQLVQLYEDATLLIDTSAMETYGMAVAEALINNIPVLSLGNGNVKHLIQRNNGIICSNMKELIFQLIKYSNDEIQLSTVRLNQDHIIFDWNKFLIQFKSFHAV